MTTPRGWGLPALLLVLAVAPADAAPSAARIMAACLEVQGPAALRKLGIDPRIRTREDAAARARAVCQELVDQCTAAPAGEACQLVLGDLGLAARLAPPSAGAALFEAARTGADDRLRTLLAEGADADWRGVGGWTPLMIAAAERQPGSVALLLAARADPDLRNVHGRTALMFAAAYGQTPIVRQLLAAGADPDLQPTDSTGWTALIAAAAGGHTSAVQALLAAGADARLAASDGQRAIDVARAAGHRQVVDLLAAAAR